eukprot:370111_1
MAKYIPVPRKLIMESLYLILSTTFVLNIVNSTCIESTDDLYHKLCYIHGQMTSTNLQAIYSTTFNNFIPLQDHTYTSSTSTIECDIIEHPSSVASGHLCFACCIATVESEENSVILDDEYTKWRLLFQINENLSNFLDDLITNGGEQVTYIFYAQANNILSPTPCPTVMHPPPRICNYPFKNRFKLTLTLDTDNDKVKFELVDGLP